MDAEIFCLCDFAQDEGGKLSVIGVFDTLYAREFPAVHPLLCIAARLRFAIYELGKHAFSVRFVDTEGRSIAPPFEGNLEVDGIGFDSATANVALRVRDLVLPGEASWRAVLTVDGNDLAKAPLHIRRAP